MLITHAFPMQHQPDLAVWLACARITKTTTIKG